MALLQPLRWAASLILLARLHGLDLAVWDFQTTGAGERWSPLHDCRRDAQDPVRGITVHITGPDPYLAGPAHDFPAGQPLWIELELRSDSGGTAQLFYFGAEGPSEPNSVRFAVPADRWVTTRVPLPPLGPGTRFRFDPPGQRGQCAVRRIRLEPRILPDIPPWPVPQAPQLSPASPRIQSGDLELIHGNSLGAFALRIAGRPAAVGGSSPRVGYQIGSGSRWFALTNPVRLESRDKTLVISTESLDPDGGRWRVQQEFQPAQRPGAIEIETRVTVDRDRSVLYLPLLTLFPGVDGFGTNKVQGLFAGVEYLENEPSSSERDLVGPQARRQVPDPLKLTFPLMALAADGRWQALVWEPAAQVSAVFDSPDRLFHSGGHVMGLLYPGAEPALREEGRLVPYEGVLLRSDAPLRVRATVLGGLGDTVVPAVQEFVARRGLPPLPNPGSTAPEYFEQAARGWLDSAIRDGDRYRHAVGPGFPSQPAADAAVYQEWLAGRVRNADLAQQLRNAAERAWNAVPASQRWSQQVGHLRSPVAPLVRGAVEENAEAARVDGQRVLAAFEPDGTYPYRPPAQGPDYGRTHWSREANGLAGTAVLAVLQRAVFSGDPALRNEGLRLLRALGRFRHTVPRGAQTWEIPLHTPDLLASAALVHAYTLGYELTGDPEFLSEARYWAWTGVPFIYLTAPNDGAVGVYSTIAVLGATQWIAPNWIGLPVQWCGLVYADALLRLAPHDPSGPWRTLARGIALAGIQHTHPASETEVQGLLPDSFDLRTQSRNPVPINPATLLPMALRALGEAPVYDLHSFRRAGLVIHAPGPIESLEDSATRIRFRVQGWPERPWNVLVNGLQRRPIVTVDGRPSEPDFPREFHSASGRLVLTLDRAGVIELNTGPEALPLGNGSGQ